MSEQLDKIPLATGNTRPAPKTDAERQAATRARRKKEGKSQIPLWLTTEEQAKVKALLAGQLVVDSAPIAAERDALAARLERTCAHNRELLDEVRKYQDKTFTQEETLLALRLQLQPAENAIKNSAAIAAERDTLAARLEKARALNSELLDDIRKYQDETLTQEKTIQALRLQLQKAENALAAKPAKTFKVPELADRRAVIAKALSFEKAWRGVEEMNTHKLKVQSDLAKKFSTEIKQARSRLASLVAITAGAELLEQSKTKSSTFGGWNKFDPPIVSPAEQALLLEACAVMSRIEGDVERAGSDVYKLHKQREAEDKARWVAAGAALDAVLFNTLDRRGEALFVAASFGNQTGFGYGWDELIDGTKGDRPPFMNAPESFRRALSEAKGRAIRHVADAMKKSTGKSAAELANEIADKYRHPDTREKFGAIADQVTAFLVSEQLSGSK